MKRLGPALAALILLGCGHTRGATLDAVRLAPSVAPKVVASPTPTPMSSASPTPVVPTSRALARQLARVRAALTPQRYHLKAYHRAAATLDAELDASWTPSALTLSVADTNVLAGAGSQLSWDGADHVTLARGAWHEAMTLDDPRLKDLRPILPLCSLSTMLDQLEAPGWRVTGATTTSILGQATLELQLAKADGLTWLVGFYLDQPHVAYIQERGVTQLVFSGFEQAGTTKE